MYVGIYIYVCGYIYMYMGTYIYYNPNFNDKKHIHIDFIASI
jgi:hypothetical protein